MNKNDIINSARDPNGYWTIDTLSAAINKPVKLAENGDLTLNGAYSIEEVEALLSAAYMERSQMRG